MQIAILSMVTGLVLAAVAPAVASTTAPDSGGWLYDLIINYGGVAVSWALAGLAAAGSWVLVRLAAQASMRSAFIELGGHARDIVQEVWQAYVEDLKASSADGVLTPAEKAKARDMAIAKLKERLTWRTLVKIGGGWLARAFTGSSWAAKVESILGGAVETAVAESKRDAKAAGIAVPLVRNVAVLPAPLTSPPPSATAEASGGPPSPR
jgi:hypothetical protein